VSRVLEKTRFEVAPGDIHAVRVMRTILEGEDAVRAGELKPISHFILNMYFVGKKQLRLLT
jgi:hypothetical protein